MGFLAPQKGKLETELGVSKNQPAMSKGEGKKGGKLERGGAIGGCHLPTSSLSLRDCTELRNSGEKVLASFPLFQKPKPNGRTIQAE